MQRGTSGHTTQTASAREAGEHTEFTPNVIVRVGTRPGLDQPADAVMELAGSLDGRPNATIGASEPVEVGGTSFHRCEVSWADPRGVAIRQVHLFAGLPREDGLQDFVHVTGSVGGWSAEADLARCGEDPGLRPGQTLGRWVARPARSGDQAWFGAWLGPGSGMPPARRCAGGIPGGA